MQETLDGRPVSLTPSPDGRWLAYRLIDGEQKQLLVRSVAGLFGKASDTVHYLGMLSPVASYRWNDGVLEIVYREAAGGGEPDAVARQRFDPDTGRFVK